MICFANIRTRNRRKQNHVKSWPGYDARMMVYFWAEVFVVQELVSTHIIFFSAGADCMMDSFPTPGSNIIDFSPSQPYLSLLLSTQPQSLLSPAKSACLSNHAP